MKYIGFPRPSYPLVAIVKPVGLVFCKCLSKRKKMQSWLVLFDKKYNSGDSFTQVIISKDK
jgi:spermidine/putrescine-binding protein